MVKYCKDCKYMILGRCRRPIPNSKPDIVHGIVYTYENNCYLERYNFLGWIMNRCGPDAKYFEPLNKKQSSSTHTTKASIPY